MSKFRVYVYAEQKWTGNIKKERHLAVEYFIRTTNIPNNIVELLKQRLGPKFTELTRQELIKENII